MKLIADKIKILSASIVSNETPNGFISLNTSPYISLLVDGICITITCDKENIENILSSIKHNETFFEVNETL